MRVDLYVILHLIAICLVSADAIGQSCPVLPAQGVQPASTDIASACNAAGTNALGTAGPTYSTIGVGNPPSRVAGRLPCIILKAVAYTESSWRQFTSAGSTVVSSDCGYGIMQITSGMTGGSGFDPQRVASEYQYNIGTGAKILIDKWNATPLVGNNDPDVAEDWYYAVWAYNGFSYINNPNNPRYSPSRPPFDGSQPRGNYPYQELVWGFAAHPPSGNWQAETLTLPGSQLIAATPSHIDTPQPTHGTGCNVGGPTLPRITTFDIEPRSAPVGTQFVATVAGNAGSNPLSTAALMWTADLSGNSGWTQAAAQAVSGSSISVSLYHTPPIGTFLYGAHLVDNTGQYGVEPSKVQVTVVSQSSSEIVSLTAVPQQASWVYYQVNAPYGQWYISDSVGETYLLSGASGYTGELVWGEIANLNPVATVNYVTRTVYVAPSASTQTSATSYPGFTIYNRTPVNVMSSRAYTAAQQVAGQTMSHAWYFFQVQSTGIWYIVNVTGTTTYVYRLQLKPDNSDYDWLLISNSAWKRTFAGSASSMTITLSEK